ncbi:hypothetical protein [Flavobacterium sp. CF136]|uniref:hypothetical protein n=1 Tax=Flavobacterium sp. (strain CF136) TaxID=1144313 RepID=UPI0002715A8E|nr:hypothetical protein [Flavobacterium sp. CF136]EJL66760.1 hypothetical protein PMI10_00338 [Flavobacterium sp. CF136]
MEIKKNAVENYKFFCSLEGSDYIATPFALEVILRLITTFKSKRILEIGMGIGCVADTILKYNDKNKLEIEYSGTEKNDFCLKALPINVAFFKDVILYSELKEIKNEKFDFIIIDGSDEALMNIKEYCNKHTVLFIEGDRQIQVQTVVKVFPKSLYVNVITLEKNPPYAHEGRDINSYIGGGQLIFANPTFQMKIYWFKEKVKTFIKRKIRKFKRK